jgi:hypothetical protein
MNGVKQSFLGGLAATLLLLSSAASAQIAPSIVGVWLVKDSDGKGVWKMVDGRVRGKFVEITADRVTHKFIGIGEISFDLTVTGDHFEGSGSARFYNADRQPTEGPFATTFAGSRVTVE